MADTAIFDVDGTLVDTNYQHALAWQRAFRRYDVSRPLWRIHRAIGMGGDNLVPDVAGQDVEQEHGDDLRDAWVEEFDRLLGDIEPFEGAHELLQEVKDRGFKLVLASSGKAKHVDVFLDLVDGKSLADAWTTSEDAETSKPEPDLVSTALAKVEGAAGIMIGDSTWDVVAASKLKIPTIAVRSGGYSVGELHEAGAVQVFQSLVEFRAAIEGTPLARATS
ncbi:haloacid dehalogenase superfamily, subfamily IA, variant 1 with third motif having Dx(3-4)D or Dx(3-4)E [Jatrophihabitans endophyticus]|uniref:Haloacid dehalogenase superfamily, subfamily IA, variant 1 with third motif having Dx(3-4)D or Dx(3-4)E n=1 Tax=Jatrophihabitans endophyticus TaxID=1206085 RepID=A0A1M5SYJ0_9ACTN|nr:HAD family hydrolase [Jatrophihabitans endophyticus]SHH43536.1 haloacid dehalogenase superfamily, subfamily IA, variant 1 with third motif having Dx(3-4)D or Dx(3-4)E [Jatrophihabitans endophyticus]